VTLNIHVFYAMSTGEMLPIEMVEHSGRQESSTQPLWKSLITYDDTVPILQNDYISVRTYCLTGLRKSTSMKAQRDLRRTSCQTNQQILWNKIRLERLRVSLYFKKFPAFYWIPSEKLI